MMMVSSPGGGLATVKTDNPIFGDGNETPLGVHLATDPGNKLVVKETGLYADGGNSDLTLDEVQALIDAQNLGNGTVFATYNVTNLTELIAAWASARVNPLPSNIYAAGTITLIADLYLALHTVAGRRIAIIGVPNATINLNGFKLTSATEYYENISFSNPNLTGYLFSENGYVQCKNCTFVTDGLDASYNLRMPIPHITITALGNGTNNTGLINIDGIQHNTNNVGWNTNNVIQPIWVKVACGGFGKLYVRITNVLALNSFERFSRVLITSDAANSIFVTGDTTWFYVPEQLMPGDGFINENSIISKKISFDNVRIGQTANGTPVKTLGVNAAGEVVMFDEADGVSLSIFKQGANGAVFPQIVPADVVARQIVKLKIASNCADLSVTIGATTYDKTNLVGVNIPMGTEIIINDLVVKAGYDNSNAIITLI
jgi:hypothetical protein